MLEWDQIPTIVIEKTHAMQNELQIDEVFASTYSKNIYSSPIVATQNSTVLIKFVNIKCVVKYVFSLSVALIKV